MARAPRALVVLLALGLCGVARSASATPCGATFTDDPLLQNTVAKAVHVTELRTAINCVRAEVSLGAASWTQTITAGTTTISAVDVTEMRTALNAAYSAASLTAPSYTDTSLTGVVIKAIHLQELRTAVRILTTPDASSATWTLSYYHTDVIGSVRAITDSSGNTVIRHDYAPFGEDSQPLTGDPIRFGGKELDAESGWNYFDARYFRNIYGRFGTVDPIDGNVFDTQSWNKYAYARNNPFIYVDPTGLQFQERVDCNRTDNTKPCPGGDVGDDYNIERFWDIWFMSRICHILFNNCPGNQDDDPDDGPGPDGPGPGPGPGPDPVPDPGPGPGPGPDPAPGPDPGPGPGPGPGPPRPAGWVCSSKICYNLLEVQVSVGMVVPPAMLARYPAKALIKELHHVVPKYLGGAVGGAVMRINGAYHQFITNEFRRLWPYGQSPPNAKQLQRILEEVYSKYPLS